eukprot:349282-Prymnesium_polylepis.1
MGRMRNTYCDLHYPLAARPEMARQPATLPARPPETHDEPDPPRAQCAQRPLARPCYPLARTRSNQGPHSHANISWRIFHANISWSEIVAHRRRRFHPTCRCVPHRSRRHRECAP